MKLQDLPSDVREAANAAAGNWRQFESFAWHDKPDDAVDWAIFYLSNRDSGALDLSNEAAVHRALDDAGDPDNWRGESHSHWAVGHVDGIAVRARDASSEPTAAFRAIHACAMRLADYPVLDEDDLSDREREAEVEAWDNHGAYEMRTAMSNLSEVHDTDFFLAVPDDALWRAWQALADEPCVHEGGGVYFPFDRVLDRLTWPEVRAALRDGIVEACYRPRCHTDAGLVARDGTFVCSRCGGCSGVVRRDSALDAAVREGRAWPTKPRCAHEDCRESYRRTGSTEMSAECHRREVSP